MRLLLATAANGKVLYFKTPDDFFLFLQRRFKYQDTTNLAMSATSFNFGEHALSTWKTNSKCVSAIFVSNWKVYTTPYFLKSGHDALGYTQTLLI